MIQDKPKGELPEVTDILVPLPEASAAAAQVMEAAKPENTMETTDKEPMNQELRLQREEEQCAIYISMLSEEEESDTDTDNNICPFFCLKIITNLETVNSD